MPKFAYFVALMTLVASPALGAEYYVAQIPNKGCKIVTEKPDGQTSIMIGSAYATKEEAKAAKRATAECTPKDKAN